MIDSDGNIIFGNAASNKSKTGKNIMLMSYSEDEIAADDTDGTVWTAVINTQNSPLTMRDAPSQSGRTICKIPKGETVKVLKKGDWAKVEYDGEQGYVNGKYLKYEE